MHGSQQQEQKRPGGGAETIKRRRETIAERFKNPDSGFDLVIVRDMWLTGFDAPSLHTLYIDKPMSGHGLMQAIARVNRVWGDKPGGLVADYLGIGLESFYRRRGSPAPNLRRW
jgi:type I site-specific restriction-modification system R (restriction) subunit